MVKKSEKIIIFIATTIHKIHIVVIFPNEGL